ncbi:PAS domain S-box [Desulfosporosinus orientis DSM 765]|uniref:PAS domain S-box n=1 Tax=Desulfosporosinus orientis (strain ATCC 19365 / DSM 765 / NCIMB 8382 / VKM B-1628 / Singapore I) TaxID=768706 RepID=G7WGQ5_DESOD|nr:sigma-54-dependent Fis family transcriptional regulator [Desulfosporosinus orientis]AET68491.1 PAS domain S-box [Desulfosporosinus orientis DSM 765]
MYNEIKKNSLINYSMPVTDVMNTYFKPLRRDDTLRTAFQYFKETKLDTLPVVDEQGRLIGVCPKRRLYKALLKGSSLEQTCAPFIVESPKFFSSDLTYDKVSFDGRIGTVPVVDHDGKVVGMIGLKEFLYQSLNQVSFSYASLDSILRAIYEGMIVVDNNGNILKINPSAENMFGIKAEDVIGSSLMEVLPELPFSSQFTQGVKTIVCCIPVLINQVPIFQDGVQIGINIAILDMSDLERIAAELESVKELQSTLSGLLSALSDGVFVLDYAGCIKYINDAASHLVHENPDKIIGKPLVEFLNCSDPVQVRQTGIAEVDVCKIDGKNCMVSHVPISANDDSDKIVGVISIVYLDDNKLTETIARKWFSLRQQVQYYRDEFEKWGIENSSFEQIISQNLEFMTKKVEALRIARSSSTVLLTGESGVGKDMFARAIHSASLQRAKHAFVKVNCAAIPETLFESEMFGYAPGSFTGAYAGGKIGYFEMANEGTIFLDEVGEMPLSIQVKLLQVIQDKKYTRVGETSPRDVDVRIIAATNRDLRNAINKGLFREDLFYRLNVIEMALPPLRSRSEDIIPLANMFIKKYNGILGSSVTGLSSTVEEALVRYPWPGNIRELENAIERAVNFAWEGEIRVEHLPRDILNPVQDIYVPNSYVTVLNDLGKDIILDALKKTDGNKSAAARLLKMSRSAFYEKLAKYGI